MAPNNVAYGSGTVTLSATATSGLPGVGSLVSGPCTLAIATVTITGAGTCVFQATQAGNTNYSAATPVSQSLTITQARPRTITFGALAEVLAFGTSPTGTTDRDGDHQDWR